MNAFNGFTEEQQKERQNELEDFDDEGDDSDIEDEAPAEKKNFDIGDILG